MKFYETKDSNLNNVLILGFTNGNIEIFKVFINEELTENYHIRRNLLHKLL